MKNVSLMSGLLLMALASAHAQSPNLIQNGGFEHMKDGVPSGWRSTAPEAELIEVEFPVEEERGTIAKVDLLQSVGKGAYFSQSIKVEPHTRYKLTLLARMNQGRITVAVGGGTGEKRLNERLIGEPSTRMPMAPLFWKEDWYQNLRFVSGEWRPVTLEFDTGELTQIAVSFGAYFSVGSYSFDDVSLVAIGKTPSQKQ